MADIPPSTETTHTKPTEPRVTSLKEIEEAVPMMEGSVISHLVQNTQVKTVSDASDDNVRKLEAERAAVELEGRKQYFEIRRG